MSTTTPINASSTTTDGPASRPRRGERAIGGGRPPRETPGYAMRRVGAAVVAGAALALSLSAMASLHDGTLASFGGRPASAAEVSPAPVVPRPTHVARPGDTMWSIAADHRGSIDHDRYLAALIDVNGQVGVLVGQAVTLP